MKGSLVGRSALITGASQGLGREIARHYIGAGASVFLCGRDAGTLEDARRELSAAARPGQRVIAQAADVSQREAVALLTSAALDAFPDLQILVNNAGIYGPMGSSESVDWDEWVRTVEINLFGPILLCRALLPHFKTQRYGKIVQLSGGGATAPLPNISAYAASKAAVVRFAETLAEELRGSGVDVNALAPGALNTRLLDEVLDAGQARVGEAFYGRAVKQKADGGTPLAKGAELAVFLGSAASDGLTGKVLSAVWDPWDSFNEHRAELDGSDIYTLRRITPRDRGKTWGER
jgi:NAD(P)-dependent dehydrogenase (short-subunit alcohol dehydrogenase family)